MFSQRTPHKIVHRPKKTINRAPKLPRISSIGITLRFNGLSTYRGSGRNNFLNAAISWIAYCFKRLGLNCWTELYGLNCKGVTFSLEVGAIDTDDAYNNSLEATRQRPTAGPAKSGSM